MESGTSKLQRRAEDDEVDLEEDDEVDLEEASDSSRQPKQFLEVPGVSLTAELRGASDNVSVLVEETYSFSVPRQMLSQLDSETLRKLLCALDLHQPVLCMAVIESDGTKLYGLRRVFFPQETRDAIEASERAVSSSQRIAR